MEDVKCWRRHFTSKSWRISSTFSISRVSCWSRNYERLIRTCWPQMETESICSLTWLAARSTSFAVRTVFHRWLRWVWYWLFYFDWNGQKLPWVVTSMPSWITTLNTLKPFAREWFFFFKVPDFQIKFCIQFVCGDGWHRIGRIVQTRQAQPWLQPELLFQCHPMAKTQQKCLDILHGFTDKVSDDLWVRAVVSRVFSLAVDGSL